MEKPAPLLTLRPQFDSALVMVNAGLAGVVGTIVMTVVGGTLLYVLLMILQLGFIPPGYIYGLILVASIVAIPPLFFEMCKKAYQRTAFVFYPDHVEYQFFQFFMSRRRGRFKYRDVTDVSQHATPLQEQRGLTTISLYIPALRYQKNSFPGVRIPDVRIKQDHLGKIMDIIDASNRNPGVPVTPPTGGNSPQSR